MDGLPVEIFKHGGSKIVSSCTLSLLKYGRRKAFLQTSERQRSATYLKKEGDRADYSNYRRISLLRAAEKILARILLYRLQTVIVGLLPESQAGSRAERSIVDMIFKFVLRQLRRGQLGYDMADHAQVWLTTKVSQNRGGAARGQQESGCN